MPLPFLGGWPSLEQLSISHVGEIMGMSHQAWSVNTVLARLFLEWICCLIRLVLYISCSLTAQVTSLPTEYLCPGIEGGFLIKNWISVLFSFFF
jgi:hypothetical protein